VMVGFDAHIIIQAIILTEYCLRCVLTTRISGTENSVPESTDFLRRNT
jgi:hypothetical protein